MKKIGVLGGTFNPVHHAHLILAAQAKEQFGLDEIWFMVSKHPPHKDNRCIVSDEHRLNMLRLATAGRDDFIVSDFELQREGVTYSADTFRILHEDDSINEYYLIIGGDSLMEFENWYHPEIILKYAHIIAATRSSLNNSEIISQIERLTDEFGGDIQLLSAPSMDISSNFIRSRCSMGMDISFYVPDDVRDYIIKNHLYENEVINTLTSILKSELPASRFKHTLGVAQTAAVLAEENDFDPVRAYLAGLLHDCAKSVPYDKILEVTLKCGLESTDIERRNPGALLHSKLGEYYARTRFGITDEEILGAIRCHTTGRPDMTLIEKIIFVSDSIEPGRPDGGKYDLSHIRAAAHRDIDIAVYYALKSSIDYLQSSNHEIDEITLETYEYYKKVCDTKSVITRRTQRRNED